MKSAIATSMDHSGRAPNLRHAGQRTDHRLRRDRLSGADWRVPAVTEYQRISAEHRPQRIDDAAAPTRVALIGVSCLMRAGLRAVLEPQASFTITAVGDDTQVVLGQDPAARPHLALVAASHESGIGPAVVEQIRRLAPETKVIVMDLLPDPERIIGFVRAGASGFVLKDATPDELIGTIRTVAAGREAIPAALAGPMLAYVANLPMTAAPSLTESGPMTKREREVAALIAKGLANKEIAQRLNLATYTIKSHVGSILRKLGVDSRVKVATYALQSQVASGRNWD